MQNLPLHRIVPDPDQPRQTVDATALAELQDSLWPQGLVEPIVVTAPADPEGLFKILVGERRYQAFLKNQERAAALFAAADPPPENHPAYRYNRWTEIPAVVATEPTPRTGFSFSSPRTTTAWRSPSSKPPGPTPARSSCLGLTAQASARGRTSPKMCSPAI